MQFSPDQLVGAGLILLSVSAMLLVAFAVPLFIQLMNTSMAFQKLAETLETELPPTLHEAKNVIESVNQLRNATTQRVTEVSHRVEDVAGSVNQAADVAKRQSSVWGAGLLAGVQNYLAGKEAKPAENQNQQIAQNRGE